MFWESEMRCGWDDVVCNVTLRKSMIFWDLNELLMNVLNCVGLFLVDDMHIGW